VDYILQVADWQFIIKVLKQNKELSKKPLIMKLAKRLFLTRKSSLPELKFQKQQLSNSARSVGWLFFNSSFLI
jgi:hypothetical protein